MTPSLTRSLTQLLTRSFIRSTSFTFITHLHEGKREIKSEYTYLIHQSPDAAVERIRADIFNYFSTLSRITSQAAPESINRLITRSLTRLLTPSVTRSLTQLLTCSFIRSTSFITLLHEEKKETKRERVKELERERGIEYTYLIHQSPDADAERIRTDIFNYFSTLSKSTSQTSPASLKRLITSSLTRSLTPSLTRSLTQLLTRSFHRLPSFITLLYEEEKEIKSERVKELEREQERKRTGSESPFKFPIEDTNEPYLIHQSPGAAAERIRTDIFNYFSTLSKITSQASAVSLNHLITSSLTRSLTPSLTRSLTQLLTRSFHRSTSFITLLHEEKRETKSEIVKELERERGIEYTYFIHQSPDADAERIRADIFNYFSTLSKITSQASAASLNRLITSSLTRSLTPSLTRSLTQLLTRSFHRSTSFITLLHEEKKEIKSERVIKSERIKELEREQERKRTGSESPFKFPIADIKAPYLSHQSPQVAAERIRADIFNYFSTLSKITSQTSPASLNRLITSSLTRSLTPSLTRSLTQLLTRSFHRSTSFITLLHEEKKEIKSERVIKSERIKELEREQERKRTGSESPFKFPIADIKAPYLSHQSPQVAAERIRADIFNYFSTLSRVTSQASPASINRLITQSLTRSFTQLLTRSFNRFTTFTTHLHEQEREREIRESITRSFTQLLTRSFSPSTSFTTHLHEGNGTGIENRQFETGGPDAVREPMPSDVFNHPSFITHLSHLSPFTLHQLTASSSTASFTTVFTPSSTRSFNHTTAFITYLHKGRKEKESRVEMGTAAAKETRTGKLEMEKSAPRTYGEAVKEKAPLPEMPGFERKRLELRYTSALYLAGQQDIQVPHAHKKGAPLSLSMSAKEWLSSRAVITHIEEPGAEPSSIENFLRNGAKQAAAGHPTAAQRIIDLRSLAGENDSDRLPMIKYAQTAENHLFEERIKKIEQTITTHTKQFETRMKEAITTSASSFAAGVSSTLPQDLDLSGLTDNIYNLLIERIKRERRMMGY